MCKIDNMIEARNVIKDCVSWANGKFEFGSPVYLEDLGPDAYYYADYIEFDEEFGEILVGYHMEYHYSDRKDNYDVVDLKAHITNEGWVLHLASAIKDMEKNEEPWSSAKDFVGISDWADNAARVACRKMDILDELGY